jgi:hypothetical protein
MFVALVQCNYCGYERSDAEFWAHLQEGMQGGSPVETTAA